MLCSVFSTGEQDESVCKTYITQVRDLRLKIEDCESRTVARIRQPVEKDPLKDCLQKASDQKVRALNSCFSYKPIHFISEDH